MSDLRQVGLFFTSGIKSSLDPPILDRRNGGRSMNKIMYLLTGLLLSSAAFAQNGGVVLDISAFYFQTNDERASADGSSTTKYEQSYLFWGLGICYQFAPFCIGGKYFTGEIGTLNSNGIIDGSIEYEGFGVSAGYVNNGWSLQLAYLLDAEKRIGDAGFGGDTAIEYPAKQAYLVDIGYGFNMGSFLAGPMLRVSEFSYKKRVINGQSQALPATEKDGYQMPMLAIWAFF